MKPINLNLLNGDVFGAIKYVSIFYFMELKWTFPTLQYRLNPAAVYKLEFNNGYYYIGSSMHVKNRLKSWKTNLNRNFFQSKLIEHSVKGATAVVATILEICTVSNSKELKERETEYLLTCFKDPLFLNMSPSGLNNTGLSFKVLPEQLIKPKKEKKKPPPKPKKGKFNPAEDYVWAYSKGIIQFDLNGNYVKSYKSMMDAAKANGVKLKSIREAVKSKRYKTGVNGFAFKVCGDNSPIVLLKKRERKERVYRAIKNTITGEVFPNLTIVAQKEGIKNTAYFWKQLNGQKPNPHPYCYV